MYISSRKSLLFQSTACCHWKISDSRALVHINCRVYPHVQAGQLHSIQQAAHPSQIGNAANAQSINKENKEVMLKDGGNQAMKQHKVGGQNCRMLTLYASSKTLAIWADLAVSEKPTMLSALMTLTKGNPLASPRVAARAVLPAPGGPSSKAVNNVVCALFCTCVTAEWHGFENACKQIPNQMIEFVDAHSGASKGFGTTRCCLETSVTHQCHLCHDNR